MGVLGNPDHERFCQAAHKRIWTGEKHVAAYHAAYRETIYQGFDPDDRAIAPNVRKLRNRKDVKGRLAELRDYAAKLAGIDSGWAMVQLKGFVESNLDDYLAPPDGDGSRFFDLTNVSREKIGHLSELNLEEETELDDDEPARRIRKIRMKLHDRIGALGLMARIAGWAAPTKSEITGKDGEPLMPISDADRARALAAFLAKAPGKQVTA